MITYGTATSDIEILQIIELQKQNLAANLTTEQISSQGFVTVQHSFSDLKKMNGIEQHIIAKDNGKVIAYLLAMTEASKNDIPVLIPMFEIFDNTEYLNKQISAYRYIVVGQVCVADGHRGQGILDNCYAAYRNHFINRYDFAITEIARKNERSLRAHVRVGFRLVQQYHAPDGEEWDIVIWNWKTT